MGRIMKHHRLWASQCKYNASWEVLISCSWLGWISAQWGLRLWLPLIRSHSVLWCQADLFSALKPHLPWYFCRFFPQWQLPTLILLNKPKTPPSSFVNTMSPFCVPRFLFTRLSDANQIQTTTLKFCFGEGQVRHMGSFNLCNYYIK